MHLATQDAHLLNYYYYYNRPLSNFAGKKMGLKLEAEVCGTNGETRFEG
jgi:hypothetical protein